MANQQNKTFISSFDLEKNGYFGVAPFTDAEIGFGAFKQLNDSDVGNVTLIKISIRSQIFRDTEIERKPLIISAIYVKKTQEGLIIRPPKDINLSDPIDLQFTDEYFYNVKTNDLYKGCRKISADSLIKEVYNKHIKSTKAVWGFFTRAKVRFWRILVKETFGLIAKVFYLLLILISGNRYTYEPSLGEGKLNDKTVSSKHPDIIKVETTVELELHEGKKFNFFGYEASQWSIIFYSVLHSLFYIYFIYIGYRPAFLADIAKSNFLVIIYAILSLWILEVIIPALIMFFIRLFSRLSAHALYKTIKL